MANKPSTPCSNFNSKHHSSKWSNSNNNNNKCTAETNAPLYTIQACHHTRSDLLSLPVHPLLSFCLSLSLCCALISSCRTQTTRDNTNSTSSNTNSKTNKQN